MDFQARGLERVFVTPDQIRKLNWIEDKEKFIENQERYIQNLEVKLKEYDSLVEKDPSRSLVEKRLEKLEEIRLFFGKIMIQPKDELLVKLPLIDLEIEKLQKEKIVMEFLWEVRRPDGLLGKEIKESLADTPLKFLVEFNDDTNAGYMDFVRGFVMSIMSEAKAGASFLEIIKNDPEAAIDLIVSPFTSVSIENLKKLYEIMPEIGGIMMDNFIGKIRKSDGKYLAYISGRLFGVLGMSMATGSLLPLKKFNKFVGLVSKASLSGGRATMKYVGMTGDAYEILNNEDLHEQTLRILHKKLPEIDLMNLRDGLKKMIRFMISLPPEKQAREIATLMKFLDTEKLKDLQKSEQMNIWIGMWLQRQESQEQIGIGLKLWSDKFQNIVSKKKTHKIKQDTDEEIDNFFLNTIGLPYVESEVDRMERFKEDLFEVLNSNKQEIREFVYENRELMRKLILIETPFGWKVSFKSLMEGIVTKLQSHVGLGDLFSEEELRVGFSVIYPQEYNGDKILLAKSRKGRQYLNKDGKYLAIFDDCDIIIR